MALESAPAGAYLDGVADEGIPLRDIAEIIGKKLNLPVNSISPEEASAHFGFLGAIASADIPRSSEKTRELLGWQPTHLSLLEELEQGTLFQ
ncbi:hypothetical protein AGMMS49975_14520 [Clostridia bacterium]|nr:hypothetical protein AGMMS49975_14520 [Clostridia bacterium]